MPSVPDRIGNYRIAQEIGRGSFATVYRGDKVVGRLVTVYYIDTDISLTSCRLYRPSIHYYRLR